MQNWINLNEQPPQAKEGYVLGCDWYIGNEESDFRIMICELPVEQSYWCGIKKGHALGVFNSICPWIGYGHNAHWMEIPSDRWNVFDPDKYPFTNSDLHEVLIKLKNGNFYTGFIELSGMLPSWCPSFNMMRHGDSDDIECWRELPPSPAFKAKPALTAEEEEIQKEWLKQFTGK